MVYKFSFHNHSVFSNDKFLKNETPYAILRQIEKDKIRFIAITDARNDLFFDFIIKNRHHYKGMCNIAPVTNAILRIVYNDQESFILRGMEKHDFNGHLLIIGTDKKIVYNKHYSIDDWINFAHDYGGLCGAPHPILRFAGGIGEDTLIRYIDKLDFIESFNAQLIFYKKANIHAENISNKFNIPGIATSDSHNHRNIAKAYFLTMKNIPPDINAIKSLISEKNFKNKKSYISYIDLIQTYIIKRV